MDKKNVKRSSGYLSQVIKDMEAVIDNAEDLKAELRKFVSDRILESYKNGIKAGQKKAEQQ